MRIRRRRRPLRTPAERVGLLRNADRPPPASVSGSDEALLARALRERDEGAFRRVVERFFSPMVRLARIYVRTSDEAEEVVQETWLAALGGIGRFRGRASIRTWLFHILRNRARTRGKRAARTIPFSQLQDPDIHAGPEIDPAAHSWGAGRVHGADCGDPERDLLAGELRSQVDRALKHLPARQREVMVLRDVEGWTSEEVRAALGLSEGNQRVLLHRARSRVREVLRPYLELGEPAMRVA